MSEFSGEDSEGDGEVGFAALQQKISRSEVLTEVPIGYVRTETNGIEKTPDRQVQESIVEVFFTVPAGWHVRQCCSGIGWKKFRCVVTDAMRTGGRKCVGPCRVTTASWRF